MKLRIVIHIDEHSFTIINGKPRIHRLVENIVDASKSINKLYNIHLCLYHEYGSQIFNTHEAYLNTLKTNGLPITYESGVVDTLYLIEEHDPDYTLIIRSQQIYLDNNWLYNLLSFVNKHRLQAAHLFVLNTSNSQSTSLGDELYCNLNDRKHRRAYVINDILE